MEQQIVRLKNKLNGFLTKLIQHESSFVRKELFVEEYKTEIQKLLEDLHCYLTTTDNVETSLQTLPDIGQFLGRLCGSQVIKGNQDLYKIMISCVLALHRQNPTTPLETRAKKWAVAQLHSTVSLPERYIPSCSIGISSSTVMANHVEQMTNKIHRVLQGKRNSSRKWDWNHGYLPCDGELLGDLLKELTDLLLCTPHFEEFQSVWEDVLGIMSQCDKRDPSILTIYQRLTLHLIDFQISGKSKQILSANGYQSLWASYLPALEMEVLLLCENGMKYCLQSSIKRLLQQTHLTAVCVKSLPIFLAVSQMVNHLFQQSQASNLLSRLLVVFFRQVRDSAEIDCIQVTQMLPPISKSMSVLLQSFPAEQEISMGLYCLILKETFQNRIPEEKMSSEENVKLETAQILEQFSDARCPGRVNSSCALAPSLCLKFNNMSDAPADSQSAYLCRISECLDGLVDTDPGLSIIYHYKLYITALKSSLLCNRKYVEGCLNIVSFLSHPKQKDLHHVMKNLLHRSVMALRSLLHKVNLEHTDIVYIITAASVEQQSDKTRSVIGQFIMAFLYSAVGGVKIFSEILSLVTCSKYSLDHLTSMMISHEDLDIDFTKWSPYRLREYKDMVKEVLSQAKSQQFRNKFYQEIIQAAETFIRVT